MKKANTQNSSNENNSNEENEFDFNISLNLKYFIDSMNRLSNILAEKSVEILTVKKSIFDSNSQMESKFENTKVYNLHSKLQKTCQFLNEKFVFTQDKSTSEFQETIIKKFYKTLSANLDIFFPESKIDLFQIKNDEGKLVSIIPGLDIDLITRDKLTTDEDMNQIWGNLYIMFISATTILTATNKSSKTEKSRSVIPDMRKKVQEMNIVEGKAFFNPFIGLNADTGEYDVSTYSENLKNIPAEQKESMVGAGGMQQLLGMLNGANANELVNHLKNVSDDEIDEIANNLSGYVGGDGDNDVNDLFKGTLKNFIGNLSGEENPNLINVMQKTAAEMRGNIDPSKLAKAQGVFGNFINNGKENIKNAKDKDGNPVGEKLDGAFDISGMLSGIAGMMNQQGGEGNKKSKGKGKNKQEMPDMNAMFANLMNQQGQANPNAPNMPDMSQLFSMMGQPPQQGQSNNVDKSKGKNSQKKK